MLLNGVQESSVQYSSVMSVAERGRRHTRDDVARVALSILDDYGLPDLTMRRLAAALDVQPSALYWHFPNKQGLLAALADRIVMQVAAMRPGPIGAHQIPAEAAALRHALLAHRDGAEVVSSTLALGLGAAKARERLAEAITADGFDDPTARRTAAALLHFILGHVSHEQQRTQYGSMGVLPARAPDTVLEEEDSAAEFAFGVDLLVNGLEHGRSRD